jgi:nitrite reductase/ring-hydroxylating ferredoxin subunit
MNRRGLCINACQIASLVALGSLLEDCGGSPTSPSDSQPELKAVNGTVAGGALTVAVAADSPLASVGGAALVQSSSGAFLVARVGQDTFNAMTAVCTHAQCTVNEFGNSMFQCPCHGSQYSTSGSVVRGPASQSLRRFNTTFAGNILTIALS